MEENWKRLNPEFSCGWMLTLWLWYGTWLVLLVHQLANEFDLCNSRKALTSCQKQLHLVTISDDISVTLGRRLLPTCTQVQVSRASISSLTRPASDSRKNSGWACFRFCFLPASHFTSKRHNYILFTWFAHDGKWSQGIRSWYFGLLMNEAVRFKPDHRRFQTRASPCIARVKFWSVVLIAYTTIWSCGTMGQSPPTVRTTDNLKLDGL